MRLAIASLLMLVPSVAWAQFPPPGIYACSDAAGATVGTLSLLVAGDYQFDKPDGARASGQVASAATSLEALTGMLADKHWRGDFSTEAGQTVFVFSTDDGPVTCR